jgi:hypothetical protein
VGCDDAACGEAVCPGDHLDSKWVRMCVNKIENKGLFFNSDRVTRVTSTRLGYGIRPKMAKGWLVLFSKVVLKRVHFRIC